MKTLIKAIPIALLCAAGITPSVHAIDTCNSPDQSKPIASQTVFFKISDDVSYWKGSDLRVYCWNDGYVNSKDFRDNNNAGMTNLYGDIWYYNYPAEFQKDGKVIFLTKAGTNNWAQTIDNDLKNHHLYTVTGTTSDGDDKGKRITSSESFYGTEGGVIYFASNPGDVSVIKLPTSDAECTADWDYYATVTPVQLSNTLYYVNCPAGTKVIRYGNLDYVDFQAGKSYDASGNAGSFSSLPDNINLSKTVFFNNSDKNWDKVYAYCWSKADNGDTTAKNAAWPGVEAKYLKDGIWYYVPDKDYANIIFNGGDSDNKSKDLKLQYGNIYNGNENENESGSAYSAKKTSGSVIYFQNTNNWENVYVSYSVVSSEDSGDTANKQMTYLGDGIYSYEVPDGTYLVAFSDGTGSTEAFDYVEGKVYNADNSGKIEMPANLYIVGQVNSTDWAVNNIGQLTKYPGLGTVNDAFASGEGFFYKGKVNGKFFFSEHADLTNTEWSALNGVIIAPAGSTAVTFDKTLTSNTYDSQDQVTGNTELPMAEIPFSFQAFNYAGEKPGLRMATASEENAFSLDGLNTESTYYIALDYTNQVIRVVEVQSGISTGVDATIVADEDAETEYFTLQGVKTYNPSNGIYIVRKGDKVSKVVIR